MPWGFAIVNGIAGHLVPVFTDIGEVQYVPGAFQSIFMVAFGLYVLLIVFKRYGIFSGFVVPIIFGFIFHFTAVIVPMLWFQWIPEDIRWILFLSATSVLPVLLMPTLKKVLNIRVWKR